MANSINQDNVNEFNQAFKPVSLWADAWKRLRRNRMALVGLWIVSIYTVISLAAPLLTQTGILLDYTEQNMVHIGLPPSFQPAGQLVIKKYEARIAELEAALAEREAQDQAGSGFDFFSQGTMAEEFDESGNPIVKEGETAAAGENAADMSAYSAYNKTDPVTEELESTKERLQGVREEVAINPLHSRIYVLGTDDLGRDMLSRVIYGGRISILIGIVGALTAALIGIIVGAVSGYVGGWLDNVLMRFVDIMYGLPYMLIVIIIMAMIGDAARGSFIVLFGAIALVSWLTMARVVRGQIISLKNSEYVEAARSMGASTPRIIFRHLLPNTLGVIIVYSTLMMPSFIMNESFLSFLGLGVSAPDASWGTLVNEGVRGMQLNPYLLLVPAIAMTLFLFCMNFLGDGVRDALDPQSKNRT